MAILKKLNRIELQEMAYTMSDAFLFHKNFMYLIANEKRRKKALHSLFLMMFKVINKHGFIFIVEKENDKIGYITYLDESKQSLNLRNVLMTGGLIHAIKFLFHAGTKSFSKFYNYLKVYNSVDHKHNANAIHLYSTGVKLEYRGKRLMSVSFRKSFDYLKEIGYTIIELETSDETNIAVYKKMGFTITNQIQAKDKLQTIYFFELNL